MYYDGTNHISDGLVDARLVVWAVDEEAPVSIPGRRHFGNDFL